MGCRNSNLWVFFPCVSYRNRSRQEEVQKCLFGVSARRAVKYFTLSADWLTRNQRVKGTEKPFTLKGFSPIFGEEDGRKREVYGRKMGIFFILQSPNQSLRRSCSIQDVCRPSSAPCWRCEALPYSSGFYSNMAWTEKFLWECLGAQIVGILGSYQISCYLFNALFGGFSIQWSSEQIKLFIDELSFSRNWGITG